GTYPDAIVNLSWPYAVANSPTPDELAKEYTGRALKDLTDPKTPTQVTRKAGEQLAGFAELRDDGSTLSGCWIYCGAWGPAGNLMARRDNSDPPGMGPFIMNPEGVARFFARGNLVEGPFPEHYEPFETPLAHNPLSPGQPQALSNPAARVFQDDHAAFGKVEQFPHVATTYRLTEHFHYWTKHVRLNAILQPEQFVEIGEGLAKELGIAAGDRVKVSSNRGFIKAVAVVTKRLRTLPADGKAVHTVGIPIHWGFPGL